MPLITWGPAFQVGNKTIDEQHQKLIDLVNRLNDAMRAGHSKEVLNDVLTQLVDYTVYHFGTEERLMAEHHYEFSAAHKNEHQKFVQEVGSFKKRFDQGQATISSDIMTFLRDWLARHIMATDKKLANALQKSAAR